MIWKGALLGNKQSHQNSRGSQDHTRKHIQQQKTKNAANLFLVVKEKGKEEEHEI